MVYFHSQTTLIKQSGLTPQHSGTLSYNRMVCITFHAPLQLGIDKRPNAIIIILHSKALPHVHNILKDKK